MVPRAGGEKGGGHGSRADGKVRVTAFDVVTEERKEKLRQVTPSHGGRQQPHDVKSRQLNGLYCLPFACLVYYGVLESEYHRTAAEKDCAFYSRSIRYPGVFTAVACPGCASPSLAPTAVANAPVQNSRSRKEGTSLHPPVISAGIPPRKNNFYSPRMSPAIASTQCLRLRQRYRDVSGA